MKNFTISETVTTPRIDFCKSGIISISGNASSDNTEHIFDELKDIVKHLSSNNLFMEIDLTGVHYAFKWYFINFMQTLIDAEHIEKIYVLWSHSEPDKNNREFSDVVKSLSGKVQLSNAIIHSQLVYN